MGFFGNLFGKKVSSELAFAPLVTDLHSHLLPGIDDGAKTLDDSELLVRELIRLGFTGAITTPHIMSDGYPNTPKIILEKRDAVRERLVQAGINFRLEVAAEYYLDEAFEEKIGKEELLTFGGDQKYLLFETSYVNRPMALETVIFKMRTAGYQPVLAHPERYSFFWDDGGVEEIGKLKEKEVLLQMNISSLAGVYHTRAAKLARELMAKNWIDFIGTDLHKERQVQYLHESWKKSEAIRNLVASGQLRNPGLLSAKK